MHNIFIDIGWGGGWLAIIAFTWILWNYRCTIKIPAITILINWYFCYNNFWLFWLLLKETPKNWELNNNDDNKHSYNILDNILNKISFNKFKF